MDLSLSRKRHKLMRSLRRAGARIAGVRFRGAANCPGWLEPLYESLSDWIYLGEPPMSDAKWAVLRFEYGRFCTIAVFAEEQELSDSLKVLYLRAKRNDPSTLKFSFFPHVHQGSALVLRDGNDRLIACYRGTRSTEVETLLNSKMDRHWFSVAGGVLDPRDGDAVIDILSKEFNTLVTEFESTS